MAAKSRNDRITLSGIRLRPRLGVTPGERRLPQSCEADVSVWGDFEAAATTDSLDKTVDYSRVLAKVLEVADSAEFNLLEALAYRLAKEVIQGFPVRRVTVRIRKRPASLAEKVDFIEVEMEES